MKVLFVHTVDVVQSSEQPLTSLEEIQMGISYMSSALKARGHSTALAVLSPTRAKAGHRILDRELAQHRPQVIAFTAVCSQYTFVAKLSRHVRRLQPDLYQVVGGAHVTLNPEDVIRDGFDAVCIGEGEFPICELADALSSGQTPAQIPNLWIRMPDGTIEENAPRPFLEDLDALPYPDRSLWHPWLREKEGARVSVLLGRGCPYKCTYCCNHALAKCAPGRYVRFRSPDNILGEIRALQASYPDKAYVYLEVETITLNKEWLFELTDKLKAYNESLTTPIAYGTNFRVSPPALDPQVFRAMQEANFISINIGLESGSERIRRDVLDRRYSNDDFLKAVSLARSHGMKVNVYSMIGLPGETLQDFEETIRMNRLAEPARIIKAIFFPYPGTKLFEICRNQGLFSEMPDGTYERRKAVLSLPGFSRRQVQRAYVLFEFRVFRGKKPLPILLIRTIRNMVKTSSWANYLYLQLVQIPVFDKLRARGEDSINACSVERLARKSTESASR